MKGFAREFWIGQWLLMVLLVWGWAGFVSPSPAQAENITFLLDWVPNGRHVSFVAGNAKGFFREVGLDVQMPRGFGGPDSIKKVAGGQGHFSLSDTPQMIMARSRDVPIKIIGFLHDKGQIAVFALKRSGIRAPKDLEGRTAGDAPVGNIVFFPAFASLHGIKKWNVTTIVPAAKMKTLIAGKIDFIVGVTTQYPVLKVMGKKTGKQIVYMPFSEHGMDLYGTGFFTTDERIQENPGLVRRFAQASTKAIAWAVENPDEAVKLFVQVHPTTTSRMIKAQWSMVVDQMKTDRFRKLGFAHGDEGKLSRTIDTVTKLMKLPRKVSNGEMYTGEFLPKIAPKF